MEYIVFIHNNTDSKTTDAQWQAFFAEANASGLFLGGSEIANRSQIGKKAVNNIVDTIAGFMRFEADDVNSLLALLDKHPVLIQGGTLELCEMPKT